jgi:outer membrane protein assembly factor BamB
VPGRRSWRAASSLPPSTAVPLVAFDLHEGTQLWKLATPGSRARTFGRRFGLSALAEGLVIAWMDAPNPEDGSFLFAVDPSTGAVVWRRAFQGPPGNVVAFGGRIFGCTGSVHFGVDARTGRRLGSSGGLCDYAPVGGPSPFGIVSHGSGGIVAVDLADLHELWRVSVPADGTPNAVTDHGVVYVPSKDSSGRTTGGVRALAADTGKQLWRIDIDGGVSDRPALAGKMLIVAGDLTCRTDPCGGAIYAIRR